MFGIGKTVVRSFRGFIILGVILVVPFLNNVRVSALPMEHSTKSVANCASYCAKSQTSSPQQEAALTQSETDIPVPPVEDSFYGHSQSPISTKLLRAQELFRSSSFKPPDLNRLYVLFRF